MIISYIIIIIYYYIIAQLKELMVIDFTTIIPCIVICDKYTWTKPKVH